MGQRAGVDPRSLVDFFRTDKCRFFVIGKKRKDEQYWKPWRMRAIEGHSVQGVDVQESAYFLVPSQIKRLPAMCHGKKQQATPSILYSGLSPARRQGGMCSVFPRWDSRIGRGQRSNHGESTADLAVNVDPSLQLPP